MVFSATSVMAQRGTCTSGAVDMYTVIDGVTTSDTTDGLSGTINDVTPGAEVKVGSANPYINWGEVESFNIEVSSDNGEPSITIDNSNIGSYGQAWQPTIPVAYFTAGAVTTVALTVNPDASNPYNGCTTPWTYTWTFNVSSVVPDYRSDCTSSTNMYIIIDGTTTNDTTDALSAAINDVPVGGPVKVGSNPYIDQAAVSSFSINVSSDNGEPSITIDNSNIGSYGEAWQPTIPAAFFTTGAVVTVAMTVDPDDASMPSGCTQPWTYTWTLTTATTCVPGDYNAYSNLADGDGGSWVDHATGITTIDLYDVPSSPIYIGVDPKTSSPQVEWNGCGQTAVVSAELYFTPTFNASGMCTVTGNFTNNCGDLVVYTFNLSQNSLGVEGTNLKGFSLYPNPANNVLNLKYNGEANISIFNVIGKEIQSTTVNQEKTIDISNMTNGVYFLKISDGKATSVRKLIKE